MPSEINWITGWVTIKKFCPILNTECDKDSESQKFL